MSNNPNGFLGLNSINVLKDYIDKEIQTGLNGKSGLSAVTINAYKAFDNGAELHTPTGGSYEPIASHITYPHNPNDTTDKWSDLTTVISELTANGESDLSEVLMTKSIYMSVGVINLGTMTISVWSTPMKISGQNGQDGVDGIDGAEFKFAYAVDGEFAPTVLPLEDVDGKREI